MTRSSDLEIHLSDQAHAWETFDRFFWHRLRSEFALSAFERHVGRAPVVLDIGAGAGVFGAHFTRRFPEGRYAFVEPIPELSKLLKRRFGNASDWTHVDYGGANCIVLLDVLEHQKDDQAFLGELIARLKPGAIVVVTCPAMELLWSQWDVKLGHFRRYTLGSFRTVLKTSGLEILHAQYLFQAMVFPGLIRRLRPPVGSEFPNLPDVVNNAIYSLGRVEQRFGSWLPFGTSVAAICQCPHAVSS